MSAFNAIGEGGLNDVLERRLNTQGESPSPTVEPAIFPALILENDRPEYGYLKNEIRYASTASIAANAGFRSSISLCATRPNTLVVLEHLDIAAATITMQWQFLGLDILPAGSAAAAVSVDSRANTGNLTQRAASTVITDNTLAAAGGTIFATYTTSVTWTRPIILKAGWRLYISPAADNVAITQSNFYWRERQANPRELV